METWSLIITGIALLLAVAIAAYFWRRTRWLAFGVLGWFGISLIASLNGFFQSAGGWTDGDVIGFMIFGTLMTLPLIALGVAWLRSPALRDTLDAIPLPLLIGIEVYRVAGAIFWWMGAQAMMPAEMALITGFSDVVIGLTALPLAWALVRGLRGTRRLAIAWNIFGIADFVIAVSLVSLSIFGLIALDPDPVRIGLHPLALIALFQLPVSIAIHTLALRQLLTQERSETWQPSSSSAHPKASA